MDGSSPRPLSRGREGPCVALHDSGDDADYQRLDVCRRELAQWKARALEAEARLAAVAAVFGHTSNAGLASPTTVCLKDDQPMPRLLEIKGPAERRHDERKHAKPGPLSRTKRYVRLILRPCRSNCRSVDQQQTHFQPPHLVRQQHVLRRLRASRVQHCRSRTRNLLPQMPTRLPLRLLLLSPHLLR
ncbi:uncharacterized protein SCHCODRAFT_02337971 [Schizophyllum commune H4-8]|uniref:uncharacterized protein n=1 Tax=Schizophyllum commune (strain H4-8 / FGSC 9210) TaxID=578458 RepID=UPI002160D813|nr:uncharacterized protein SCHCODRAFT_02337971 [Schizophyllum commune H4-8]KAI5890175.1 hypothetical protein SCHCODRAFT_02337971 [Schizophyllum commune H4-8]